MPTTDVEAFVPAAIQFNDVEDVIAFLDALGASPMIEPGLVELDHALQCAAELKALRPDDEELQVAGLVHDIAHGRCHIRDHDRVGAEALRPIFGDRVANLVALHVEAKRYLVVADDGYRARLSPVSIKTMELQGGAMNTAEIAAFEAKPNAQDACLLRMADEAAKLAGRDVPGLNAWIDTLRHVASSRS
ncbi:MAG: hypothetical protein B7Y44_10900 [Sphingomonadales bacterium 28-55-16]|nr:MAG: hypothetical protein B7Y44_10900 [Sphingomonadales bacterium 28-55-16]